MNVVLRRSRQKGLDDQRDHLADLDETVRRAGVDDDEHGEHQHQCDDGDDGDGEVLRKVVHTHSARKWAGLQGRARASHPVETWRALCQIFLRPVTL